MTSPLRHSRLLDGPSLALFALASAFFPRVLTAYGAPAILNFAHFGVVAALFAVAVLERPADRFRQLGFGLYTFAMVIALSALLNHAGFINVVLEWVLVAEPFLMLALVLRARWSAEQVERFSRWVFLFLMAHVLLAHFQFAQGATGDDVKGVFLNQGAGHHVGGAVALTGAFYYYAYPPVRRLARGLALLLAVFIGAVVVTSDSKQVIAVFMAAGGLLLAIKQVAALRGEASGRRVALYFFALIAAGAFLVWAAFTFFPALRGWARPELVQWGLAHKYSVFSIIASYFDAGLNWVVGLGPGHTVGRLGTIMPDYYSLLEPLDATTNAVTGYIVYVNETHWMSSVATGSSMWMLNFSYAGIWGDLGFLGLGTYLALWLFVWRHLCHTDLARFFVLNILLFGGVFAWLEEPGYMLFVATLLGTMHLRWQAGLDRDA